MKANPPKGRKLSPADSQRPAQGVRRKIKKEDLEDIGEAST